MTVGVDVVREGEAERYDLVPADPRLGCSDDSDLLLVYPVIQFDIAFEFGFFGFPLEMGKLLLCLVA